MRCNARAWVEALLTKARSQVLPDEGRGASHFFVDNAKRIGSPVGISCRAKEQRCESRHFLLYFLSVEDWRIVAAALFGKNDCWWS